MSSNKDNIDEKIREALLTEDAELFAEVGGERNIAEQIADSFRGQSRWFSVMAFVAMSLLFGVTLLTGFMFFEATTVREMIAYAGGFFFSIVGMGMMKVWYFMELNKNTVTREIKRVELQIARLSARIGK